MSRVQKRKLLRSSSLFASHVFCQLLGRKWHPCTARTNACMATLPSITRSGRLVDLAGQRKPIMLRVPGRYPEDSSRLARKPGNILVVVLASIISQRPALTGEMRPEGAVLGRLASAGIPQGSKMGRGTSSDTLLFGTICAMDSINPSRRLAYAAQLVEVGHLELV